MRFARFLSSALFLTATLSAAVSARGASPVAGAWRPDLYTMKDGSEQPVTGRIFFTERDWTVLFFVLGEDGAPERGSGEGGTYTLDGDRLVFTHLYHLSGGSTPFSMSVKESGDADTEPCRVEVTGETMTIYFPSGNRMRFQKRSDD